MSEYAVEIWTTSQFIIKDPLDINIESYIPSVGMFELNSYFAHNPIQP